MARTVPGCVVDAENEASGAAGLLDARLELRLHLVGFARSRFLARHEPGEEVGHRAAVARTVDPTRPHRRCETGLRFDLFHHDTGPVEAGVERGSEYTRVGIRRLLVL